MPLEPFRRDLNWAWRALRRRGSRAWLVASLLGVTLAANALMFGVADSLVFNRLPYPTASRLVELRRSTDGRSSNSVSPALLEGWRKQTDLFERVEGYALKNGVFVFGEGAVAQVPTADVTPGLIAMLGVAPRWGRLLAPGDEQDVAVQTVLLSERVAAQQFGRADRAVGRRLQSSSQPMLVVGVMPSSFGFPDGNVGLWRAIDPRGPLMRNFAGVQTLALTAPGVTPNRLRQAMRDRSPAIGVAAGVGGEYLAEPGRFSALDRAPSSSLFLVLLGAAFCLLLSACANVASLELAASLHRARTYAVQLALGASRGTLARVVVLEGALLIAASVVAGLALTWFGIEALKAYLPSRLIDVTANPLHLDARTVVYMTTAAVLTWLLVSLPIVIHASRSDLLGFLKLEDRGSAVSRAGSRARQVLTVIEVALAVLLVIGGTLYVRSYRTLTGLDKGFDSTTLAQVDFSMPTSTLSGAGELRAFQNDVLRRVRDLPGVVAAARGSVPVPASMFGGVKIGVDGEPPGDEVLTIGLANVDPDYFAVVKAPLEGGHVFAPDAARTDVVVPKAFALHFWPTVDAVGHTFQASTAFFGYPDKPWFTVVGVVGDVSSNLRRPPSPHDTAFFFYAPVVSAPGRPVSASQEPTIDTGGSFRFSTFLVKLDSSTRLDAVLAAARAVNPRLRATADMVDSSYARQFSDVLLATRVVSMFGALAFVVAIVGVYGVMAFLVAGRTREIGIRMALGADRRDIGRLVLRSSLAMVVAGVAMGAGAALVASRWLAAQFFGIAATDPVTYAGVAAAIAVTALVATWRPARQAARVDPASTLRGE